MLRKGKLINAACNAALAGFLILGIGLSGASAQEPGAQPATGQALEEKQASQSATRQADIEGILIGTVQMASDSHVKGQDVEPEGSGQFYLFGTLPMGEGAWNLELRAGTTPRDRGVTSFYGEVNDTVGETLNSDGDGRIAATQLFYAVSVGSGELSLGLLDATSLLDANEIADDEYTQFLGTSFVNNPSIEYPSFALGLNYRAPISDNLGYQVFVSSTGGLEDENDPTYNNTVNVGEDGKGVFAGGELLVNVGDVYGSFGGWYNGADHSQLNNPAADNKDNYGGYVSGGGPLGPGQWVVWGGVANDKVSPVANFMAAAYAVDIQRTTLGVGLSRIGDSDHLPGKTDAIVQAEIYLRINVYQNFYVTPDLQYVNNSGFDPSLDGVVVGGLRAGLEF